MIRPVLRATYGPALGMVLVPSVVRARGVWLTPLVLLLAAPQVVLYAVTRRLSGST